MDPRPAQIRLNPSPIIEDLECQVAPNPDLIGSVYLIRSDLGHKLIPVGPPLALSVIHGTMGLEMDSYQYI